jgi:hypothetical protein
VTPPAPRTCGACGHPARPPFRAPQPELAPDLDMRPGEPARSTLAEWLQTCRGCGAVAQDLTALTGPALAVVRSDEYRALDAALPFHRWALICARTGDPAQQAEALLQAAWAADDADATAEAAALRRQVAALWAHATDIELGLRRLDVLRRAGLFQVAADWAAELRGRGADELAGTVIAFQAARIAAGDSGRHMMSSALRPPARAPHVSHGKRASGGFWSRLLGR